MGLTFIGKRSHRQVRIHPMITHARAMREPARTQGQASHVSALQRVLLGIAVMIVSGAAMAQSAWPNKPIRLLHSIASGSLTDIVARAMAEELSKRLGQPLVVENRPGGNMIIAAEACAHAAGDGYTACILSVDALSSNPNTYDKLPYDVDRDFKPVTLLFYVQEALVANAAVPANSVAELRTLAQERSGKLYLGTLGPDSSPDLFLTWLRDRWKTDLVAVPYKGGGPIASAVLAGEVELGYLGLGNFLAGLQSGKVKALAVGSSQRVAQFPNVPTMAEAGLGGYGVRPWWGMVMPAATPDAIVSRLNAEVTKLYAEPKFAEFLSSRFLEVAPGTPEEFAAFLKADRIRAGEVIRFARQAHGAGTTQ